MPDLYPYQTATLLAVVYNLIPLLFDYFLSWRRRNEVIFFGFLSLFGSSAFSSMAMMLISQPYNKTLAEVCWCCVSLFNLWVLTLWWPTKEDYSPKGMIKLKADRMRNMRVDSCQDRFNAAFKRLLEADESN